jgi:hypothetical protein
VGVEGDPVAHRQPEVPERGGTKQIGAAIRHADASVDFERCHLGDGKVGAEAAEPGEGGAGAVFSALDCAIGGQEAHLQSWTAIGMAQQRHRGHRDPVGGTHPRAVVDLDLGSECGVEALDR